MSNCPSLAQLEAFLEEQDSDANHISLTHHIERCFHCQEKLEEITCEDSLGQASAGVGPRPQTSDRVSDLPTAQANFLARLKETLPNKGGLSDSRAGQSLSRTASGKVSTTALTKLPVVSGYEILGELGRGGMGVVYQARQLGLNRLVALKMILAGSHAGPKDLVRFRQEAEAVAQLRHPNIIQIHDIGEANGCPYLALEFVAGESLASLLRGTPQPQDPAVRLLETLARTMHYAHQRNIVHRDLKPANILLQLEESTAGPEDTSFFLLPVAAMPKITDFGLAKRLDDQQHGSQTGDVVGTPSYMAPEQAAHHGESVGPATDVYALGAVLYELLTGRPPFRSSSALDTVLQVLHEEPIRPSYLRRDLARDLETICLKCLSKEPSKRYASAEALADDLYCFRKGKPIKARAVGMGERVWKWARHRPLTASLLTGMILIALLGFAGITWQWQQTRLARDDMEFQKQQAEDARRKEAEQRQRARLSLYFSRIAQSQLQWRVNDVPGAKQNLAKCLPAAGQEDHRGWEWYYLQGLFHNDFRTLEHRHNGLGGAVAYDPAGERIATLVSGPPAGETALPADVRIWDAKTGELKQVLTGPSTVQRLVFRPDGKRLALGTADGVIMVWDMRSGKELLRKPMHAQAVSALAYSPDGRVVASVSWDKTLKIWDASTGKVRHECRGHEGRIQSVAFHPRQPLVATGSWDTTVTLWDTNTGKAQQTFSGHKMAVYCVAFSPNGQFLVSAASNGNLKLWELSTGRTVQSLTGDTGAVLSVSFSPDGRYLAKGGKDGTVRIWHLITGVERKLFRGHTAPVEGVSFSPDCRSVVSISPGEGMAKVWDLTRHPEYGTFARTEADVEALTFAEEGKHLVSVTGGGKLQVWNVASGILLDERSLPLNKEIVSPAVPVAFAANGKYLAGRSEKDARIVQVWQTATATEAATLQGHTVAVACVRFSGDGRYLLTCACGPQNTEPAHEIKVWEVASGKALVTLLGKGRIFNGVFSPKGRLLAWSGQEGKVTLVDWHVPAKEWKCTGHRGDVSGLAFSPDGTLLASAGMEDRTVKLWKVDELLQGTNQVWQTMSAPNLVCDLAFSPNGRRLAAITRDLVKMWEVETGHEALTLRGAPQRYWDPSFNPRLVFSPDGTQLAGTNWDESISIWEAPALQSEEQFARFQEKRRQFAEQRANSWHLDEAELCLSRKLLLAARFHLQQVPRAQLASSLQKRWENLQAALERVPKEK